MFDKLNEVLLYKAADVYTVRIEADTNDGDYIDKLSDVSELELEFIKYMYSKLDRGNWPSLEGIKETYPELSDEEIDVFEEYLPYLDNSDIHTITEVQYTMLIHWTDVN